MSYSEADLAHDVETAESFIMDELDEELYRDCQGHCQACYADGGCTLQDKLNKINAK